MKDKNSINIIPFANEKDSLKIDDLTIENHEDQVSFYGSFDLTNDKVGLEKTKSLISFLAKIQKALEDNAKLPDKLALKKTTTVDNPFG